MSDPVESSEAWKSFWNRGGWWRGLLAVAVYYGLYQAMAFFIVRPLFSGIWGPAGTAKFVFFTTALPIILASILLLIFIASLGWVKEIFGPQPIRGRGWMWIAVVAVLAFNVLRLVTLDYSKAGVDVVLSWMFAGLFIGLAEETLTRGVVVDLMRKAGHREIAVALTSAALFAALHLGNLFASDQGLVATLLQVVYTFFFGILMYLALRVSGRLIVPVLLHASTDPTIFLSTEYSAGGPLAIIGGQGNIAVILAGLVLVFFIRGQVEARSEPAERSIV